MHMCAHITHTVAMFQEASKKLELQQQMKTDKQGSVPRQLADRMEQLVYNTCTHKTD